MSPRPVPCPRQAWGGNADCSWEASGMCGEATGMPEDRETEGCQGSGLPYATSVGSESRFEEPRGYLWTELPEESHFTFLSL